MFRATCLTLLAVATSMAQSSDLAQAVKDPNALGRWIGSHPDLKWPDVAKALGSNRFDPRGCGLDENKPSPCTVEMVTAQNPEQVILLVKSDQRLEDVYLRYLKQADGSWRFSGENSTENKKHPRGHKVEYSQGKPFLRVAGQALDDPDIETQLERLYDLSRPGLDVVFGMDLESISHGAPGGIDRNIAGSYTIQSPVTIEEKMHIEFTLADGGYKLGAIDLQGTFGRAPGGDYFIFRSASRTPGAIAVNRTTYEKLSDFDQPPPTESFLVYVMPGARAIATGSDAKAKDALRAVVVKLRDTAETRELKRLLH